MSFETAFRELDRQLEMIEKRRAHVRRMGCKLANDPALNAYYNNADREIQELRRIGYLPRTL